MPFNRRENGGLMLWCPKWSLRFISWAAKLLGMNRDGVLDLLVMRLGVWDSDTDGGVIRWQLFPWRNNIKKYVHEEQLRRFKQRQEFLEKILQELQKGPVMIVADEAEKLDPKKVN